MFELRLWQDRPPMDVNEEISSYSRSSVFCVGKLLTAHAHIGLLLTRQNSEIIVTPPFTIQIPIMSLTSASVGAIYFAAF